MENWPFRIGFIVVVILLAAYLWYTLDSRQASPDAVVATPETAGPSDAPVIRHPVEDVIPADESPPATVIDLEQPLPELEQSDARMREILARLFAEEQLERFFLLEHFIERFVVMVDSLPRAQLPTTHRPVKKVPGNFLVEKTPERTLIARANFSRYEPAIGLLEAVDPELAVTVYKRLYPLFQEAYQKLGYPKAYFNDRLIEVIDHLLTAPEVSGALEVVQPKALYLFADPVYEELSAGRKILLRVGPDNAHRLKRLMRDYRRRLAGPH